jgi:LacI family transcriptional regulator
MKPRNEPLRVIIMLQAARGVERDLLRGIARYATLTGGWTFYRKPHAYLATGSKLDMRALKAWRPDGAFCTAEDGGAFKRLGVPLIAYNVDAIPEAVPCILTEDRAAGRLAAEHLLSHGHRTFAFCGYASIRWSDERCAAFCRRVGEAGHRVEIYPAPSRKRLEWASEEPRVRDWLRTLPKPVGLMCVNDDRAESVLETCRALGYGVPEDVSLIGVDDDEYVCELQNPPLSSVSVASDQAGYDAAALLDRLMDGREKMRGVRITARATGVKERLSTSVLTVADPDVRKALRFIRENADRPVQVADVVRASRLSHRALNDRFHTGVGGSILTHVTRARVAHISRLLTETQMRVHEIADVVGYEDERHISRYFKRATGLTPQEYRRKYAMP